MDRETKLAGTCRTSPPLTTSHGLETHTHTPLRGCAAALSSYTYGTPLRTDSSPSPTVPSVQSHFSFNLSKKGRNSNYSGAGERRRRRLAKEKEKEKTRRFHSADPFESARRIRQRENLGEDWFPCRLREGSQWLSSAPQRRRLMH